MNVLSVVARLKAAPGKGDALQALLVEQAGVVRAAEPGCLVYRVHRSTTDPDVFLFYETYADDGSMRIAARRIWPLTASAARAKASRRDPRRWKCSVRAANEARGAGPRAAASALIRA